MCLGCLYNEMYSGVLSPRGVRSEAWGQSPGSKLLGWLEIRTCLFLMSKQNIYAVFLDFFCSQVSNKVPHQCQDPRISPELL